MKIIKEGLAIKRLPWWVNKTFTCPHCTEKVLFEWGDQDRSNVDASNRLVFRYTCLNCRDEVVVWENLAKEGHD